MAQINVQDMILAGVAPSYAAASAGGDYFLPGGKVCILHVKNGHTAPQTVTINDPTSRQPSGAKSWDPDVDVIVPNAAEGVILVDAGRFTDRTTGQVNLSYSGVIALTMGVFRT